MSTSTQSQNQNELRQSQGVVGAADAAAEAGKADTAVPVTGVLGTRKESESVDGSGSGGDKDNNSSAANVSASGNSTQPASKPVDPANPNTTAGNTVTTITAPENPNPIRILSPPPGSRGTKTAAEVLETRVSPVMSPSSYLAKFKPLNSV